jgi:heat shock protein HslJ
MRNFSLLKSGLLLGMIFLACTTEGIVEDPNDSNSIFGHWDIENGGTLFFESDKFSLSVGCNTLFGSVVVAQNSLTFSMIASTLMGCPEEVANRENELAKLFENASLTFEIEDDKAFLTNSSGALIMKLYRPENVSLVNFWELNSIRTENAISSSILDEGTGITFTKEGVIKVVTACNSGGGSYIVKENTLTIQELALTEMGCDQERMTREQEFTEALSKINSYSILRKTLSLENDGTVYLTLTLSE